MRILFAMSSPEYLRFYDSTIARLAERGHHVAIAVNGVRDGKPVRLDAIGGGPDRISIAGLIPPRSDRWAAFARAVRGTMDFVRYLHPSLADADKLRARMKRQALPWVLQPLDRVRSVAPGRVALAMRTLARLEQAIPPAESIARFLSEHRPDLVIVSPLVEPASDQVELVKAAHALGIRAAIAVASWDNLTNKGDLRVRADRVFVWNDAQKREAVEFHRVDPAAVAVTGSQVFDRWFSRRPSRPREAFCRAVGLPDDRPFVLFVGSSIFISRAEAEMPFVRRWIEALRASADPAVRELAILVRPHPYNGSAWKPDALAGLAGVAVWPRGGYNPIEEANRADFFDSIAYSEAVVGINTSAMIEAAIVGRPVLSIVTSDFAASQEGTLHFRHLVPENGGFLRVASTLEEHASQLGSILRNPAEVSAEIARFVASFVRPHGLERPCTEVLVEAIEQYGASPAPKPVGTTAADAAIRGAVLPLAVAAGPLLAAPSERKAGKRRRGTADAPRLSKAFVLAAALPAVAGTLIAALFVAAEVSGRTPLSYDPPRNIAEAAGMGLGSEVLRFLREGQDPNGVFPVRPDIISSSVPRATAVEAAIWSRRVPLLRLLERHGALSDAGTRQHLACLAGDIGAVQMAQYLAPEAAAACEVGRASGLVKARSQ